MDKVVAYITRGDELLVFRHTEFPEAGIQVPAGTVEPGEDSEAAVLREAREETGLDLLSVRSFLGEREYDMHPYGKAEVHRRRFFHIELLKEAPTTWRHLETSGGTKLVPVEFEFFWARMPNDVPELIAGQGDLLNEVEVT